MTAETSTPTPANLQQRSQVHKDTDRPAESSISRRDFLTLAWKGLLGLSGLLGLGGLWRFLSYQPEPSPPTVFDLGPAESLPEGTYATVSEADAVVLHTSEGFRALSLVCPHLGCIVEQTDQGFACPCHGSRFASDGSLRHGPANRPMYSLSVEIADDGHLILNTQKEEQAPG